MIKETFNTYQDRPEMNCTTLFKGFKSLKALRHAIDEPPEEPTAAMRLGTVSHSLVLEPHAFLAECAVMPEFRFHPENVTDTSKPSNRRTKWVEAQEHRFLEANIGKQIVSAEDHARSLKILEAVNNHELARTLIEHGRTELTVTGKLCHTPFKGRIDLIRTDQADRPPLIVDLKTCNDARMAIFARDACNYHYPEKMAVYRELVRQDCGIRPDVQLIVVESGGEHDCCVMQIPHDILDYAMGRVQRLVLEYENAEKTGNWWGVDGGIDLIDFKPPAYYMPQGELDWGDA